MTLADRKHALAVRRLVVAPPAPAQRWLAVRWDICDGETRGVLEWRIADNLPAAPSAPTTTNSPIAPAAIALWRREPDNGRSAVLASIAGAGPDAPALLRTRDELGLEHLDIPGLLSLTLRRDPATGAATVLYARTSVLHTLGVRGGRADTPHGAILHAAEHETKHPAHVS